VLKAGRRWLAVGLLTLIGLVAALQPGGAGALRTGTGNGSALAAGSNESDAPLLAEVYYRGYESGGRDQYVRVANPTAGAVDISGWRLSDGRREAVFPAGAVLPAAGSLWVARSARAFLVEQGFAPDYAISGTEPGVQAMPLAGAAPYWAHAGGVVELLDGADRIRDVVPYGDATYNGPLWTGAPVPQTDPGLVMHRALDESTAGADSPGRYLPPTHTAADWKQGTEWLSLRDLRPGQSLLPYPTFTVRDSVTAFTSPDSALSTLKRLINGAKRSIDIKIAICCHI